MNTRLERLRSSLDNTGLSCMLVTRIENVRYLSGFGGSSAAALISPESAILVTDGRYREQAAREAVGWEVQVYTGTMTGAVAAAVPDRCRCGFEATCSFDFYRKLAEALGDSRLEPVEGIIEELRMSKDDGEVECIRAALSCAALGFEKARSMIRAGVTERDLAAELDYRMMLVGADGPAFDTVVASGPNSSLPHAPLTDRKLTDGDLVVIDFGARKRGYRSDTTRTIRLGNLDERRTNILTVVVGALEAALREIKPGVPATAVDAAAREHIAAADLADHFSHSLGHGVGLETHERPSISTASTDTLEPGMVFTVEPGIYLEGCGGVRLEEMVLVTDEGSEVLSRSIPLAAG